jgi:hypothetical protein
VVRLQEGKPKAAEQTWVLRDAKEEALVPSSWTRQLLLPMLISLETLRKRVRKLSQVRPVATPKARFSTPLYAQKTSASAAVKFFKNKQEKP